MSFKSIITNKRVQKGSIAGTGVAIALAGILMIAPASGAYFSANGTGNVKVNTATLSVGFGDDAKSKTFAVGFDNLKPGDNVYKTFTVTNTGSIPADVSFYAKDLTFTKGERPNQATLALLTYHVEGSNPASVRVGTDDAKLNLGSINPGQTKSYELYLNLDPNAGNEWQGLEFNSNVDITLTQQH